MRPHHISRRPILILPPTYAQVYQVVPFPQSPHQNPSVTLSVYITYHMPHPTLEVHEEYIISS